MDRLKGVHFIVENSLIFFFHLHSRGRIDWVTCQACYHCYHFNNMLSVYFMLLGHFNNYVASLCLVGVWLLFAGCGVAMRAGAVGGRKYYEVCSFCLLQGTIFKFYIKLSFQRVPAFGQNWGEGKSSFKILLLDLAFSIRRSQLTRGGGPPPTNNFTVP